MATITLQEVSETGSSPTYTATDVAGDVVDNVRRNTFLHFKNGAELEITVTIVAQTTSVDNQMYGDLTKANATLVLAAATEGFIGPFPTAAYSNDDNQIEITYSSVSSLTVAALYLN
tara:strand:+ start:259 stop:609 length:351 start_codon:yes stop_codon:yes gene_type:complete